MHMQKHNLQVFCKVYFILFYHQSIPLKMTAILVEPTPHSTPQLDILAPTGHSEIPLTYRDAVMASLRCLYKFTA